MGNAIEMMNSYMTKEQVERSDKMANEDMLSIRLAALREKHNIRQNSVPNFSQTSVSRIEHRKDMKVSTLIEYLSSIGMGLEIRAYEKDPQFQNEDEVLLRV